MVVSSIPGRRGYSYCWVGDRLRVGKPPRYFARPTQPPTLSVTGNEYRAHCDDALWLGNKGGHDSLGTGM